MNGRRERKVPGVKNGDEMRSDGGRWMAVLVIWWVLFPWTAVLVMAGNHHTTEGVCSPLLLAKDNDKNWKRYKNLSSEEKARLRGKLRQWQSLSPEEQKQMRKKMDQLNQMPPESRKQYQKRFKQWQRLSPREQERLKRQLENWDNLSPEERESIRGRFK